MSFIVALFTDTSTELMSGAKSRKWVHHNSTNQPTNQSWRPWFATAPDFWIKLVLCQASGL